jgi:enoyl-CoA hydratase/carnithine racemase
MRFNGVIDYDVVDSVAWVTIDRPEARNAANLAVRDGLRQAIDHFNGDEGAAVLALTGAGDRALCACGDLKEMSSNELRVPPADFVPQMGRTIDVVKPTIAAVNGVAFAGGFLLAQTCDLCVAAEHAQFAITEARVGRGAPWAAPLAWLIPPRIAMELLITAAPISAWRAYDIGLVNEVVSGGELRARTQQLAETIVANAPLSVRAGKAMVYAMAEHHRREGYDEAERMWEPVYLSEDAQEGPRAFAEKRPAVWRGRWTWRRASWERSKPAGVSVANDAIARAPAAIAVR